MSDKYCSDSYDLKQAHFLRNFNSYSQKFSSYSVIRDKQFVHPGTSSPFHVAKIHQQTSVPSMSSSQSFNNKVYVNPNYKQKQPVIHVNREKCGNGIYLNRKLIDVKSQTNSKISNVPAISANSSPKKRSIYVKPEMMKSLVESVKNEKKIAVEKPIEKPLQKENYKILSKTKLVKNSSPMKKAFCVASNFKRKLVKSSPKIMKPSVVNKYKIDRTERKIRTENKIQTGTKMRTNSVSKYKLNRTIAIRKIRGSLVSKYKVDRTLHLKLTKKSKAIVLNKYKVDRTEKRRCLLKRKIGERTSTVMIEGESYKMSRNKLVRNQIGNLHKRRKAFPVPKTEEFLVTKNGKKLHRIVLKSPSLYVKRNTATSVKNTSIKNTSVRNLSIKNTKSVAIPKASQMKYLSTNARQRSLQLMQSRFHKNNQPCLVFRRYGYCPKQERGICSKVHNKKQVALCQKFLQGKCVDENCKLSHDIGPEKMPTCKYFLKACCNRDSCPYRHVKVSDNTPICSQFLEGYCEKGDQCKDRHIFLCPEFEKKGSCSKGKSCTYPHKSKQSVKKLNKKSEAAENNVKSENVSISCTEKETCQRYYDDQELTKKRTKLLNQVRSMKKSNNIRSDTPDNTELNNDIHDYMDTEDDDIIIETVRVKKVPLGTLPSFIPIA